MTAPDAAPPVLTVVRGAPSDDEVAALVAALAARPAPAPAAPRPRGPRPGGWSDPARALRAPLRAAPGGWVGSARPS
ncbi:acyl-CoA carboxylase epsilon subunit [Vallicoccus soli]|uniref:Acyl-CoA carboxylase subunit epsilon n=1 Tax=Vallicoccus soli TaxID=2339232 RepID=A0A3A3YYD1_9ACTN|nr:acyl-CoA carboxylase epsilon subunit [Vallicoccus soli]RJK95314.1 acyl-CoA carboxylase subunit epsilon [Vallicoccus soli]